MSYREWGERRVRVGGREVVLVSKPGVAWHGEVDPSVELLARHVRIDQGDVVFVFNGGNGLTAVAAAGAGAARVVVTDRNVAAVEAARRTVAANGLGGARVGAPEAAAAARGAEPAIEVHACDGSYLVDAAIAADVVIVRAPKDRASLLNLLEDAFHRLRQGGRCYLAGATDEGIKSAAKAVEQMFGGVQAIAHGSGHRVLLASKKSDAPPPPMPSGNEFHTFDARVRGMSFTLHARPGVFSREHVDEASALLADAMQIRDGDDVLDLGCGAGILGLAAATLSPAGRVMMVDVDIEAVRSAARSAEAAGLSNATALASDVASAVLDQRFDVVVTNPPFHVGKATDLDVPLQFIEDAFAVLRPGGRLYLVANRTLPYERSLQRLFGGFTVVRESPRFKVLRADSALR